MHLSGDGHSSVEGQLDFTISGQRFQKAEFKRQSFWEVAEGTKTLKNNSKDNKYKYVWIVIVPICGGWYAHLSPMVAKSNSKEKYDILKY